MIAVFGSVSVSITISTQSPTATGFVVLMSLVRNLPLIRQLYTLPSAANTSYQLPVDLVTRAFIQIPYYVPKRFLPYWQKSEKNATISLSLCPHQYAKHVKKLFLLDGMALIYRAYFALSKNPRITSTGFNTSAIFGFANTLLELLRTQQPSHIAVVFDTMAPTNRHAEFEAYKANRQAIPEDLSAAIPYVYKLIEGFNIPLITLDGYEADDIIGTLAKQAEARGYTVYCMTPDKDFGQLVTENIFIYKPARL